MTLVCDVLAEFLRHESYTEDDRNNGNNRRSNNWTEKLEKSRLGEDLNLTT